MSGVVDGGFPEPERVEGRGGTGGVSAWARRLTEAEWFRGGVIGLIVLGAVVVGLETYPGLMERFGWTLKTIDTVIVWVFVAEIALRMLAEGKRPWRFFKSGWNVFDFVIVAACLLPGGQYAAVLRLARVLRVLRLLTAVPRLQVLVMALVHGLPSIGYVALLLGGLFYVYAVLGSFLFGMNDPGHFGTLDRALLSLFRAVTLEDWTDLMYTQMFGSVAYPPHIDPVLAERLGSLPAPEPVARPMLGALYFVSFVVFGTMIVLNLFIGVILSSMSEAQAERAKQALERPRDNEDLSERLRELEARSAGLAEEIGALRRGLKGEGGRSGS